MAKKGRTTVYNNLTSEEKLAQVNSDNLQLEEDFIMYLESADKSPGTIKQYRANLHIFWCWCLDNTKDRNTGKDKFFIDLSMRDAIKFQNHALKQWGWAPKRVRTFKATLRSMENYIIKALYAEFPNYRRIWSEIESPANEPVREKTILTEQEAQSLLDALVEKKKYEIACLIALAMYSGKRKDELTRFKVSYFDKENLICDGALYKTPEKIKSKGRGSKGKMIYAYTLAKLFQPYLDLWLNERKELGIETDWLFPAYEIIVVNNKKEKFWIDDHIKTTMIDSWMKTVSKIVGKPSYIHMLRHFFTTYLLENNLPESVVQSISSWSSRDMISIYDDRDEESQFDKYFGADGIQQVEQKGITDL